MVNQFFIYDACMYEFEVDRHLPQKCQSWRSNFAVEEFQLLFLDLNTFSGPYGTCLDA